MKTFIATALSLALSSAAFAATTLEDAIQSALASHPDLQAAKSAQLATAEDVNVANGALRPRLFLNAGVGRERTDSDNVNGGEPISLTRREAGINLIWALYSPADRGEMARRMGISEGTAAGIADIEQQVALQASTAYTNLWRAGTQYEIAQQARQAHETLVDQIGRRVETGVSGEAELIQVQGRLSLSQSNESAALNALQDARANYRRVVGKLPDFEVGKTMLDWDRPPFLDMAVQNAFRDHPIIKVAEADIQEATALGQSAQGSQLPRITLELGANRNRDLDGAPGTSKDRFAMLRMNWDLYNGGSNLAAERAAGFRLTEAEHLLNDAQREVVELAHQAWNAYMTTKQQLVYLDMFVESAVNTREAYAQQFTINRRTLQEVLDSEVEVFDARSARVEAEADHVIADLQLAASQGQLLQVMQQQAN